MSIPVIDPKEVDISAYGELVTAAGRYPDAETEDFSFWNGLGILSFSRASVGIVRSHPRARHLCPALERHGDSSETLIPVNGDIVVVCALSRGDDGGRVDRDTVKALKVQTGEALILHPGVWHYAPMVRDVSVDTFVNFRENTLETDLMKEEFEEELNMEVLF